MLLKSELLAWLSSCSLFRAETVCRHPEEAGAEAGKGPPHPPSPARPPADPADLGVQEGGPQPDLQASSLLHVLPETSGLTAARSGSQWGRRCWASEGTVKTFGQFGP